MDRWIPDAWQDAEHNAQEYVKIMKKKGVLK